MQRDETIWLREAEGSEEHRVDDTEGGGVDADPETERQNNHGAEAWIASQRPDRMAKIARQRVEQRQRTLVVAGCCNLRRATQAQQRLPACRVRPKAASNVVLSEQREMRLEFSREIVPVGACNRGTQPVQETANALHDAAPFKRKNFARMSPVLSQWRRSR